MTPRANRAGRKTGGLGRELGEKAGPGQQQSSVHAQQKKKPRAAKASRDQPRRDRLPRSRSIFSAGGAHRKNFFFFLSFRGAAGSAIGIDLGGALARRSRSAGPERGVRAATPEAREQGAMASMGAAEGNGCGRRK